MSAGVIAALITAAVAAVIALGNVGLTVWLRQRDHAERKSDREAAAGARRDDQKHARELALHDTRLATGLELFRFLNRAHIELVDFTFERRVRFGHVPDDSLEGWADQVNGAFDLIEAARRELGAFSLVFGTESSATGAASAALDALFLSFQQAEKVYGALARVKSLTEVTRATQQDVSTWDQANDDRESEDAAFAKTITDAAAALTALQKETVKRLEGEG